MIQSAVTISLVEQVRGGPFVFWDGLADGCARAAKLGFDAVEIFAPSADAVDTAELTDLLEQHGLKTAAVGTGAGMVIHRLSLTDPDAARRSAAKSFVRSIIDMGGPFGAPAIIGSMQGRFGDGIDKPTAIGYLGEALSELGEYARQYDVPLIYEPLNRYETNLINTIVAGVCLLKTLSSDNVKLLADLFHMNIEEADIADGLRAGKGYIGHVHFVDSNRQPAGRGHMDYAPIAEALRQIEYVGYASVEAFPIPSSDEAAELTMEAFRKYLA